MRWLTAATRELLSLFVDDVSFTVAILAWIGVATVGLPGLGVDAGWDAPLLFLGCAVILVTGVQRAAPHRRRQKRKDATEDR